MAPGTRLDELTARYMQNPRRYFVPLANEYRKAQELDRAIALCREHLPSQPGHMSGHIVLARAYFDKGDLLAAREVFASSVELDDENLIALRHLGDIAHALGDVAEARRWYSRVLNADPQNDEVEALLRSLDDPAAGSTVDLTPRDLGTIAPDAVQPAEPAVPSAPIREPAQLDARLLETVDLETFDLATLIGMDPEIAAVELPDAPRGAQWPAEDARAAATSDIVDAPAAVNAPMSGDAAGMIIGIGFSFDDLDALAEPPAHVALADERDPQSVAGADLTTGIVASPLIANPDEPTVAAPPADESLAHPGFSALASFASWRTAQARDTPPSSPPQPATPQLTPLQLAPLQPGTASVAPIDEADAATPVFSMAFVDEPDSWETEPSVDAGAPAPEFMTETMAVLYEQQGYTQQALDIYLALQRRAPSDAFVAGKIADLQQMLAMAGSNDSLQADADKALQYEDFSDVVSLESDADASPFAPVQSIPDATLDDAFASAWNAAPAAADAGDDWFADESDIELNADVFTESDAMFGITLGGFTAPDAARDADAVPTGATAPVPVVSLASLFDGAEIGASDAAAADLLIVLAAQMVGRLPKEAPTLPVPDVLELPSSSAADSAGGATPAPLLSFDRFFSGSGSAPRGRVDTPLATNRPIASPVRGRPSLSPTFGGLPVVPPPASDSAAAWSSFDQFVPAAAEARTVQADARAAGADAGAPASTVPEASTPDAPSPVAHDPPSSPPSHADAAAGPRLDSPAAPTGEPPTESAEQEPSRGPSSDFHRWLEGLS